MEVRNEGRMMKEERADDGGTKKGWKVERMEGEKKSYLDFFMESGLKKKGRERKREVIKRRGRKDGRTDGRKEGRKEGRSIR